MPNRTQIQSQIGRASAAVVLATPSTVTVKDVNLATFNPGDRVVVLVSANRASGTTSTLQVNVLDAPDNAGAIGTPATATVTGTNAVVAAGDAGLSVRQLSLVVQAGRPWVRISATHVGGTDSFQIHAHVLTLPAAAV